MNNAERLNDEFKKFLVSPTFESEEKLIECLVRYRESFNSVRIKSNFLEGHAWSCQNDCLLLSKLDGVTVATVFPKQQGRHLVTLMETTTQFYAQHEFEAMEMVEQFLLDK